MPHPAQAHRIEITLKGFVKPISAFSIVDVKADAGQERSPSGSEQDPGEVGP